MRSQSDSRWHAVTTSTRPAGIAGVLAAVLLAGEFLFFTLSGFDQSTFNDPSTALSFLSGHGTFVRAAVFVGACGVVATLVFLYGLRERLRASTPTLSASTLYFGIVGNIGDGLVALSFWIGIPVFMTLAGRDPTAAQNSWGAFTALTGGYQGFGNLFQGLSLIAAGWAIVTWQALPRLLGAIALLAGIAAAASVVSVNASVGFLVSIVLVIVFRVWSGIELYRGGGTQTPSALAKRDPANALSHTGSASRT